MRPLANGVPVFVQLESIVGQRWGRTHCLIRHLYCYLHVWTVLFPNDLNKSVSFDSSCFNARFKVLFRI